MLMVLGVLAVLAMSAATLAHAHSRDGQGRGLGPFALFGSQVTRTS